MILPDFESCYRAVTSRDRRFDGWFLTAVRTTGIYCRPSCPAITPLRRNVEFHPSAASAQRAGFRACRRCRPDAAPGSPEWDHRGDLAGRALRLIADGTIDRDGVSGLAKQLGYSERQVSRTLLAEVGAGPLALARAQRAQTARVLLETTNLSTTDVAFAAGFASVRQFNDTMQAVFATTPTVLRTARRGQPPAETMAAKLGASVGPGTTAEPATQKLGTTKLGTIALRLPYRVPMDLGATLDFLGARAIPGVEEYDGQTYSRAISTPGGTAWFSVYSTGDAIACRLTLTDLRDLVTVVSRVRQLLDLDADPVAVDALLGADPALAPLVHKRPGLRSPGAVDGFEMAVRAVIGQQISVRGARTLLGRITSSRSDDAARAGAEMTGVAEPTGATGSSRVTASSRVTGPGPTVESLRPFLSAAQFTELDVAALPMPQTRAQTLLTLARTCVSGELSLNPGADRGRERTTLLALPGIGRWTADYIQLRTMNDPDVLLATDLGVRKSATALGVDLGDNCADWAPWRSYATHHLWAAPH